MTKVGDKEIIFNQTLLVNAGEDVWVTAPHGNDFIKIHLMFEDSAIAGGNPEVQAKPSIKVEGTQDHSAVTLKDWHSQFGATTLPLQIGKMDDGKEIWLMVDCTRRTKTSKIVIQVMLGGAQ